jgi:hypothetical protein
MVGGRLESDRRMMSRGRSDRERAGKIARGKRKGILLRTIAISISI